MEVFEKLPRDLRDRNIVDVQLVPLDEKEEEVQRTLEVGKFHTIHGNALPFILDS
jgi:hypothetical protein